MRSGRDGRPTRSRCTRASSRNAPTRRTRIASWRSSTGARAVRLTPSRTLEAALRNGVTQSEVRIKLGQYLAESGQPTRPSRCSRGDRRRSGRARRARECLSARGPAGSGDQDLQAAARDRSEERTGLGEHRHVATADRRYSGGGGIPATRDRARSRPSPAPTPLSAWCWRDRIAGAKRSMRGRAPSRKTRPNSTRSTT